MKENLIQPGMKVYDVITKYPFTRDVFISNGFEGVTKPVQLNTVARRISLEKACSMKDVDLDKFLEELNQCVIANS